MLGAREFLHATGESLLTGEIGSRGVTRRIDRPLQGLLHEKHDDERVNELQHSSAVGDAVLDALCLLCLCKNCTPEDSNARPKLGPSGTKQCQKNGSFSLIERVILSAGAMLIFSVSFQIDQMPEGEDRANLLIYILGQIIPSSGGSKALLAYGRCGEMTKTAARAGTHS